jgi:hypothetical protein
MRVNRGHCGAFRASTSLHKEKVVPALAPEVHGYLIGLYRKVARCSEGSKWTAEVEQRATWNGPHRDELTYAKTV